MGPLGRTGQSREPAPAELGYIHIKLDDDGAYFIVRRDILDANMHHQYWLGGTAYVDGGMAVLEMLARSLAQMKPVSRA